MSRRDGPWLVGAVIFTLVNAVAAGFALARGEALHSTGHAALALLGTVAALWLGARLARSDRTALPPADERLERLQQSMDAIALEVERIGEAQRFSARLQSERSEPRR